MSALLNHNDLFRYGAESQAEDVATGIKQVVLSADSQIIQSKSWFNRGAVLGAKSNPRTLVSYVLDGFFEVKVAGRSQILGPSGSFIVPTGADYEITCLEDGVLLGVLASEAPVSRALETTR